MFDLRNCSADALKRAGGATLLALPMRVEKTDCLSADILSLHWNYFDSESPLHVDFLLRLSRPLRQGGGTEKERSDVLHCGAEVPLHFLSLSQDWVRED